MTFAPSPPPLDGVTRVLYERQAQNGRVVGGIGGYMMGRVLEILWDGTEQ